MTDVQVGDTIVLTSPGVADEIKDVGFKVERVYGNFIVDIYLKTGRVSLTPEEYRVVKQAPSAQYREGYYIRLPNINAVLAATKALVEDGAEFTVKASGPTASITINNDRDRDTLERFC